MLMPAENEIHSRALEAFDRVARVVDDVALAPRPRHRQQVMMHDEDLQPGLACELLFDPGIAPPPDLTVVEIWFGRVDGDDRDSVRVQDGAAVRE